MSTSNTIQYMTLPSMKLNELLEYKQQLEDKKEKHKSLMDELSKREHEPTESDYELYRDYSEISNLLMSIEIELCRRDEHLETKEIKMKRPRICQTDFAGLATLIKSTTTLFQRSWPMNARITNVITKAIITAIRST